MQNDLTVFGGNSTEVLGGNSPEAEVEPISIDDVIGGLDPLAVKRVFGISSADEAKELR